MIGKTFSHYTIVEKVGAGGMGEVYRARDTTLEREVAIKVLPESVANDPDRLNRFTREAKLLASLNHPNIGAIYELEESDGVRFLVLEFVDGETLGQRIARNPLSARETLKVGEQIAAAVEAAHDRGIVHRDLKPGNVMLTSSRVVKVLDFGLAKGGASSELPQAPTRVQSATGKGVVLGTAPYMSPEQARGREVDRRTDVWAFGCILYECLTGHRPFAGDTGSDVIARILEREPDWKAIPDSIPVRLRDLIRSCLTKDIDERPRDIGDLRRELRAIRTDMSSVSSAIAPAAQEVPSVAVLYFENQASDTESEYFCSGITEDIITDLSKIKGLRVASRSAVTRYRGQPPEIRKVAAELSVDAVVEGTVRRAGDRVRITAQLINGSDGFQLWAERYDRTLQDVFAVQEEIASAITEALRVTLTPSEAENLVRDRPKDARAYDLYLQGREQYGRYEAASFREAIRLFEEAISIDPGYALAWAGIADTYGQLCQYDLAEDPAEAVRLGLEAADRAIQLNPRLAEGYKARSLVLRYAGDMDGSRASLIQALEANPRLTSALINLAVDQFCQANLAGAERLIRHSLEIDPQQQFAMIWLASLLNLTSRHDEVLAAAGRLREIASNAFYVTASCLLTTSAHLHRGDDAAAERELQDGLAEGADPANVRAAGALLAARTGRLEEARRTVRDLADEQALGAGALIMVASAAIRAGEPDLAARYFARNMLLRLGPSLVRLETDLHPLASNESFAPRRWDTILMWPLEAPMIDPASFALFREVHIKSGAPKGSGIQLEEPSSRHAPSTRRPSPEV